MPEDLTFQITVDAQDRVSSIARVDDHGDLVPLAANRWTTVAAPEGNLTILVFAPRPSEAGLFPPGPIRQAK